MRLAAALLLGLGLSAPGAASPPAPRAAAPAPAAQCTGYGVIAEKNDLAPEEEISGWAIAALESAGRYDRASPCFVHVRITSGPIRTGGRQDGWVAHVAVSTRRLVKDGKHVTHEKGMLLVDALRAGLLARTQRFVEDFVAKLG